MTSRGVRRPRLGQNFLARSASARKIVERLELTARDAVLEIGPGRGALTDFLVQSPCRIAAVELDRDLAEHLERRFGPDRLTLIHQDILDVELARICDRFETKRLVVVGNLPYGISKPVAGKLIRERSRVDRAVLMFQREVALRLTAGPGEKSYGPLGLLAGAAFEIRREFDLPPSCFRPQPKVISTVTRWTPRVPGPSDADVKHLRHGLAVCFASRRKTLRNNLRAVLGDDRRVEALLAETQIDGALRAESLTRGEFVRIAERLSARNRTT